MSSLPLWSRLAFMRAVPQGFKVPSLTLLPSDCHSVENLFPGLFLRFSLYTTHLGLTLLVLTLLDHPSTHPLRLAWNGAGILSLTRHGSFTTKFLHVFQLTHPFLGRVQGVVYTLLFYLNSNIFHS